MSEHTPGPWFFCPGMEDGDDSVGVSDTPPMIVHRYEHGQVISIASLDNPRSWVSEPPPFGSIRHHGTIEGNGQLIATAPDMLAQLRTDAERFRSFAAGAGEYGCQDTAAEFARYATETESVIAKAEGRDA